MELVTHSKDVLFAIQKIKVVGDRFLTNFYPDFKKINVWIEEKLLFKFEYSNSVFYIRKQDTFYYLLYFTSNLIELKRALDFILPQIPFTIVVEIITKKQKSEIMDVFLSNTFSLYATLVRLSMKTPSIIENNYPQNIRNAELNDLQFVMDRLNNDFDKYSENIPILRELEELIQNKFILVYEINNEIAGFIIGENTSQTQHMRYWYVNQEFRDLKIGSKLFKGFLVMGKNTQRQILWCLINNENALKRYEHYGYGQESLYDHILKK